MNRRFNEADFNQELFEGRFKRKMPYQTVEGYRKNADLATQIDDWVLESEVKLMRVIVMALDDMIKEMQVPKAKGGNMPVATGFLRSTGVSALNNPPKGPVRGDKKKKYKWANSGVKTTLAQMKKGDIFYFGWTAEYARWMEARNGFVEKSVMNWQEFVNKAISKLK